MPEGPEIRRVADRLGRQLVDKPLESVWFAFPELKGEGANLEGRRVMAVESWGKALLTHFDDDRVMYSHNQLYGVWNSIVPANHPRRADHSGYVFRPVAMRPASTALRMSRYGRRTK
ncbi:endonuclease-8 [Onishia taeanensis]|uniref:Endonuclease-8 n=1 Tax=Onishia taeanensis TaxID=284577 RepID=A0A328XL13_9GAMM|nr:DNA-formamidopyrimidine glycosylase family protein [Halomonas taeanensis]RAR60283.1 endonuclease-8 [Halomonas taeanensis]